MHELSSLTIIVPTYNRHIFAKRTISYWSGKKPKIIVLDGSERPLDKNFINSLKDNVKYFHEINLPYQERMEKVHDLVTTKYCMLHADDEFFLPSGLLKCIKEIEKNDLVCCVGRCLEFNFKDSEIHSQPWLPLHAPFDGYSLLDERPLARILKHMHPYLCSTIYGVTKTEVFLNNICTAINKDFENFFFELGYEISSAYQGKSKVINCLSWLRSNENPPFYTKETKDNTVEEKPHEIIINESFIKHPIVKLIANDLNRINKKYSTNVLEEVVFSALNSYAYQANLTNHLAHLFKNTLIQDCKEKDILKNLIGGDSNVKFKNKTRGLLNVVKLWVKNGIVSNEQEIIEIENTISNFHQNNITQI